MSAPFDLRFVIPVRPLAPARDLRGLVHYEATAYMPLDSAGHLPSSFVRRFQLIEQHRCAELKTIAHRFNSKDVIHFVVGFMAADLETSASSLPLRRHLIRKAVWSLMLPMLAEYRADNIDYVAALHLESEIPHVHVALSRYARTGVVARRINTLPPALLPLN